MKKYKTFEELKKELGDKFEEYMYKSNIELLNKIDKAIEWVEYYKGTKLTKEEFNSYSYWLLDILRGEDNE